jgi:hypothetical protein
MSKLPLCSLTLIGLLAWPPAAGAQSLADIARAEEARRKTVRAPAKVYTNEDLKRDGGAASAPAPATTATATPAEGAPATTVTATPAEGAPATPEATPGAPKKDEKFWRDRVTAARDTLAHDKVLADALQSRINALTTDFTNTADPAQRAVVEENRKTALAELDRINKDIEKQTKAVADIQEDARKASVPSGWLR